MAVPFRDAAEIERLGAAGFFRILPDAAPGAYRGALFLVNAHGEPLEFAYNRIRLPQPFLWRAEDVAPYAARRLAASLFEICPREPALLLCLAGEVGAALFTRDLDLAVPASRMTIEGIAPDNGEEAEDAINGARLLWAGRRPTADAPARRLLDRLAECDLLSEPFERTAAGLCEVYGPARPGEDGDDELVERTAGR